MFVQIIHALVCIHYLEDEQVSAAFLQPLFCYQVVSCIFCRYNKRKYMEITHKAQSSHTRKGAAKHMKRLKKAKK